MVSLVDCTVYITGTGDRKRRRKMKKWFTSKTFWANFIALVVQVAGINPLSPELTLQIMAGVNIVLRWITKEQITW